MKNYRLLKILLVVLSGAVAVTVTRVLVSNLHFLPSSKFMYFIIGGLVTYIAINRYEKYLEIKKRRAQRELNILKDVTLHKYKEQDKRNNSDKERRDE